MAKKTTWMSMTAGILDIICGAWAILVAFILAFLGSVIKAIAELPAMYGPIFAVVAIPFALLGILAIVGGIYALKRKIWGLALAGSIGALFSPYLWLLGIAAIVLTALSKNEFK